MWLRHFRGVSGCARGIDNLGLVWALNNNIPVKKFPAELNFALSADLGGFARNGEMAAYAEALIAIWDGVSHGTGNMIQHARARKLQIYVTTVTPDW